MLSHGFILIFKGSASHNFYLYALIAARLGYFLNDDKQRAKEKADSWEATDLTK